MDTSIREVTTQAALEEKKKLRKEFKIFDMIFITIAAIIGIDTLGAVTNAGGQALFWLLISAVTLLLPYGLLTAELGTTFPKKVVSTSGAKWLWSVTAIAAIATFFAGSPNAQIGGSVLSNTLFRIVVALIFIWGVTWSAILSLRVGKWLSVFGSYCK
jgi:glutamate:GABA antiporter